MLDKLRIKEAESNIKSYLDEGLLKKEIVDTDIIKIMKQNAKESLKVADILFKYRHSDLWTIVCSYYSMYYIANSLLNHIGYKVGEKISHKITSDALIVFIRDKLKNSLIKEYEEIMEEASVIANIKADSVIKAFDYERVKRSVIQYKTTEEKKHTKAETSLKRAKEFNFEINKLFKK